MNTPTDTLQICNAAGIRKANDGALKTFISAMFAGAFIALGAIGNQLVSSTVESASVARFLGACVFPIGLMMVTFVGVHLFTGNSLIFTSVLDGKTSVGRMFRNWGIVYAGNFAGGILVALILTACGTFDFGSGALAATVVSAAKSKCSLGFGEAFLRAIMCNVLVCIAVWATYAAKSMTGKLMGLFFPTMLFVLCGFEHCVANMYFIPAGLFAAGKYGIDAGAANWGAMFVNNLIPVTLGNMVGGTLIIALGFWAIHHTKKEAQ